MNNFHDFITEAADFLIGASKGVAGRLILEVIKLLLNFGKDQKVENAKIPKKGANVHTGVKKSRKK